MHKMRMYYCPSCGTMHEERRENCPGYLEVKNELEAEKEKALEGKIAKILNVKGE